MSPSTFEIPPLAYQVAELFSARGFEIALVGGSVRDLFLKRTFEDLDFTTNARPREMEQLLKPFLDKFWDIGNTFGTLSGIKGQTTIEITTYRSDTYLSDSRKPQVEFGDSLIGDLRRRDFSVNAMAIRLPDLELVDPFGGLNDLNAQLIRTPQSPTVSFSDDPLRMLRAARLVAQLNFTIEPATLVAISEMKERLNIVSRERVNHEFSRLLMAPGAVAGMEVLVNSGLIDYVIPEISALKMEIDPAHHHKDVYVHSLKVLQNSMDRGADLTGRLAALLHDIAKPRTRKIDRTSGKVSFLHHDVIGSKMAREILGRLKYDRETIDSVCKLIFLHLRFYGYKDVNWTDSAVRRYVVDAGAELERLHILIQSDCTTQNVAKQYALEKAYQHLLWRIEELQKTEQLSKVRPALDGHEIMEILGLGPGPMVGKAYQFLLNLRFERGVIPKAEARSALEQWFAAQTSD